MSNKADTDFLGALHGKVAQAMIDAIEASNTAVHLLAIERDNPIPDDIQDFLEKLTVINPALLTAAVKFLKDNKITAEANEGDTSKQTQLEELLASKRKRIGPFKAE